jgi:hypothetical protein
MGRDSELDPCSARVQRELKAASKDARFGAYFTQMYTFSEVCAETNISNDRSFKKGRLELGN